MFGTNPPQTKEAPRVETNRCRTVSGRDDEMHAARDETEAAECERSGLV